MKALSRFLVLTVCLLLPFGARSQSASDVIPGEYIVRLKASVANQVHGKLQGKAFLKAAFQAKGTFHLTDAELALIEELKNDPDVDFIEPNYRLSAIPAEPGAQSESAQTVTGYSQTGSNVHANEAWAASSAYSASNRPIVAVVDTGLDRNHDVFRNSSAVWVNSGEIAANGVDDDFNGYVDDVSGWNFITGTNNFYDDESHGTHVSGIVLGATQNILTTPLQPAKIRIMPLKFLDSHGSGSTSAAISAIYYAVNNGAKVINCSWGGGSYSRALHDAMTYAYSRSVLVVSAAGNYSNNNDSTAMWPANYDVPSNISVAAVSDADNLASFSNYGNSTVHLGSPGVYVYSTMPGNTFSSLSGTSMAAPFVAGSAALALREATQITAYQLKNLVLSTVDQISSMNGRSTSRGRINSQNLVTTAKTLVAASAYQPAYSPSYQAERSPSSSGDAGAKAAGCGSIAALEAGRHLGGGGSSSGGGGMATGILSILLGAPLVLWFALRRADPRSRRRFERYRLQSEIVVKSGDRELVATLQTISVGGVSFNAEEALESGGVVSMKIMSPDGREAIEVEGRIVWNERNHAYGVQFSSIEERVRKSVQTWSRALLKA